MPTSPVKKEERLLLGRADDHATCLEMERVHFLVGGELEYLHGILFRLADILLLLYRRQQFSV